MTSVYSYTSTLLAVLPYSVIQYFHHQQPYVTREFVSVRCGVFYLAGVAAKCKIGNRYRLMYQFMCDAHF